MATFFSNKYLFIVPLVLALFTSFVAGEESMVIQDFEKDIQISQWPDSGKWEFSSEWAKSGSRSLKIYSRTMATVEEMVTKDWSGYQVLRIHFYMPGDEGSALGFELRDVESTGYWNRHVNNIYTDGGESVFDYDISGDLWRGEASAMYRDKTTPIDKTKMVSISVYTRGKPVFLDKIELVKIPQMTAPGCHTFNFGPENGLGEIHWTRVDPTMSWSEERGYGFTGVPETMQKTTSHPTPLLGGGLVIDDAPFNLALPEGDHIGLILFERSGYWSREQGIYTELSVLVNDKIVHTQSEEADAPFFLFQDVEVFTQDELIDKIILPRHRPTEFTFHANKGRNTFGIKISGENTSPVRVAGLLVAPANEVGRKFLAQHKQLLREKIAKVNRLIEKKSREGNPENAEETLLVVNHQTDHVMFPKDFPATTKSEPVAAMSGFAGMRAYRLIGLYGKENLRVSAKISPLKGDKAIIPVDSVTLQRNQYLPACGYGSSTCWIESHHYRPVTDALEITPSIARALLINVDIPKDAAPGVYKSTLTLTCDPVAPGKKTEEKKFDFTLEVLPGSLPPIPMPVGLFFSGITIPRWTFKNEQEYWDLAENLFRVLQRGSKTMLTGGPSFHCRWEGDTPVFGGDDAIRFVKMAMKYGLDQKMVNYGGLGSGLGAATRSHGNFTAEQTSAAVIKAWEAFRATHGFPEHYMNAYDEPRIAHQFPPLERRLKAFRKAGIKTIGWTSMIDPDSADENHKMLVRETYAPAYNNHTKKTMDFTKEMGNEPWVYNQGLNRYAQGVHLWRNHRIGAEGRIDWIGSVIQGFQFDALDSREPDKSCYYFHKELGILIAPKFLGVCEGGIDARLLFELERKLEQYPTAPSAKITRKFFEEIESKPYRSRRGFGSDELDAIRDKALRLISSFPSS